MPLPFPAHNVSPVRIAAERLPTPRLPDEVFAPNTALRHARRLFEGHVVGSESVAVAPDGSLWMLDKWGYVWVATASGDDYSLDAQPLAYVGPGRPLGFHFTANGDLAICNSLSGLMLLERPAADSTKWRLRCLSNTAGGRPVSYANDLTIGSAGRIYFSDSSTIPPALNQAAPRPWYDTLRSFMLTLWHGGPTGRLLCYDPSTDATTVLADGLWYANGVALAADESFVAVVETCSMRVRRHWLEGPKAGSMDTLIDRLPGWPDNIVESSDGGFWLCLVLPDMPLVHKVLPQPWLRSLVAKLPEWLLPPKPQWGCVLRLSAQGEVVQALTDPDGRHVSHISSVTEHADKLFIGNLARDYVSVLDLRAVEEPH